MALYASILFSVFILFTGAAHSAEKTDIQVRKVPEIQQVKQQKPVKVKLHRSVKGDYYWEIAGDNVDEIIRTDRQLRKSLKQE